VLTHVSLSMQAIRSLSAVTIAVGGWRRSPALIVAGPRWSALGWSTGCSPHTATPAPHFGPHHGEVVRAGSRQGAGELGQGGEALVAALVADP
jgi:hypothetical protein